MLAVHAASKALERVRAGRVRIAECRPTPRPLHADSGAYRSALELAELKARDPLLLLRERALEAGWITQEEIEALDRRAQAAVAQATRFADESPAPTDLHRDVYGQPLDLYGRRP